MRGLHIATVAAAVLATATASPAQEAGVSWWNRHREFDSRHYTIKTDLPVAEANALAVHLDRIFQEYSRRLMGLPPRAPHPLNVMIFADRADYEFTLRWRFQIPSAANTGGMFFNNAQGTALAFWTGGLPRRRVHHVLQHEAFHQFAYSRFGGDLPVWVNEGLAELFGQGVLVDDRFIIDQVPTRALELVQEAVAEDDHVPFRTLLFMDQRTWNQQLERGDARLQYVQSWSMVHFLVYGEGGRYAGAFERYLGRINDSWTSERAWGHEFGRDIEAFERKWIDHVAAARPTAFVTALERIEFLAEGMLALNRLGERPTTLEGLQEALRSISFEHRLAEHGPGSRLHADDDDAYLIPMDAVCREQPLFELMDPPRHVPVQERLLEEENPRPALLVTVNLRPYEIGIRWIRDRTTNTFRYEIETARPD